MAFPSVDLWRKEALCKAPARVFNHYGKMDRCLLSVCLQFFFYFVFKNFFAYNSKRRKDGEFPGG